MIKEIQTYPIVVMKLVVKEHQRTLTTFIIPATSLSSIGFSFYSCTFVNETPLMTRPDFSYLSSDMAATSYLNSGLTFQA